MGTGADDLGSEGGDTGTKTGDATFELGDVGSEVSHGADEENGEAVAILKREDEVPELNLDVGF
jgi:hypothetical protein